MTSTETTTDSTAPQAQSGPQPEQPAVRTGAIAAGATFVLQGLTVFGLATFTTEQRTWIIMVIGFVAPLVTAYVIKGKVFSPATVQRLTSGLIADRQRADTAAVAAREAVEALKQVMPPRRPRDPESDRQRPAQRPQEGPPSTAPQPPYQSEPVTNVPAAERPRRRRVPREPEEHMPPPPRRERPTAQPEGYYDYTDGDDSYGGHAWRDRG